MKEVKLPTAGSPQTPRKRDPHWELLLLLYTLELIDSTIGSFSLCCKFKSLDDNFVWGLIGVYGPNEDNLHSTFLKELRAFMSI